MIIKAKPFRTSLTLLVWRFLAWIFSWRFNKMKIEEVAIKRDHSYILMCNHFSFWDGFWASYICLKSIYRQEPNIKNIYVMVLEKQMQQNKWLTRLGCFSVAPGTDTVNESIEYIAELLNDPGNIFLMFPQGKLESNHVRHIQVQPGIIAIVRRITGNCQMLWSSNFVEYFESLKPSIYFHMLDCGTTRDFNYRELAAKINVHHQEAIQKQYRFTKEK
jgi:1-acyl-sn-glycerol-3-phosphate acyltransferase